MKKEVKFYQVDGKKYLVDFDGETYGALTWDDNQKVWVLWPDDIDDGVSYYDDLKDTQEEISYELTHRDD